MESTLKRDLFVICDGEISHLLPQMKWLKIQKGIPKLFDPPLYLAGSGPLGFIAIPTLRYEVPKYVIHGWSFGHFTECRLCWT